MDIIKTIKDAVLGRKQRLTLISADNSREKVLIDCALEWNQGLDVEVSRHPVEEGAAISDHVNANPLEVEIRALLTPDTALQGITAGGGLFNVDVQERVDQLQAWARAGSVLTLTTYDGQIDGLVLTAVDARQAEDTGDGRTLDLLLTQIVRPQESLAAQVTDKVKQSGAVQAATKAVLQ